MNEAVPSCNLKSGETGGGGTEGRCGSRHQVYFLPIQLRQTE